ncbi:MAG: hypothetical protein ACQEXJ_21830 [Myxococcota bacterium]
MEQATRDAIVDNFSSNLARVQSLLDVHDAIGTPGPGRRTTAQTDVLRAAVVLLHASLEDLLRSSSEQLLPGAEPHVLSEIGLPRGDGTSVERFRLGELARFRGDRVDDVIRAAVMAKLERSNYNNVNQVAGALDGLGVKSTDF